MWDKTEVLLYGSWIAYAIRKGNIIMVCDESYQFNLDDIRWGGGIRNPLYRHR